MAVLLLAPDLGRLLGARAQPSGCSGRSCPSVVFAPLGPHCQRHVWILFVGYRLAGHVIGGWKSCKQTYLNPVRPPLYGLYDVENGCSNRR
jgi:hypothetical protein